MDRRGHRGGGRVDVVAGVNGEGFDAHVRGRGGTWRGVRRPRTEGRSSVPRRQWRWARPGGQIEAKGAAPFVRCAAGVEPQARPGKVRLEPFLSTREMTVKRLHALLGAGVALGAPLMLRG